MDINNFINDLSKFQKIDNLYSHPSGNIFYTDGIKYLVEKAKCNWLIEMIALIMTDERFQNEPILIYNLIVNSDSSSVLKIFDNKENFLSERNISYTDFPLKQFKIFCLNNILHLPSEQTI